MGGAQACVLTWLVVLSRLATVAFLVLASVTPAGCAESDPRTAPEPDAGGTGGSDDGQGTGGDDAQGGGGSGGDTAEPDAAVACRPGPADDPTCPEVCPEACNEVDDDCDGVVDEGADDTDCDVDHATSICTRGLCILSACDDGFRDCDGVQDNGCEVDIGGIDNCGACGNGCEFDNTVALCADGVCEPGACVLPYLDCDGEDGLCETFGETLTHCGTCGNTCAAPDRATPTCIGGACVVDECLGNFGDCNEDVADGCELPLNTQTHCGDCLVPCAYAGSATNCDDGICIVDSCSPGFADCDGSPVTACEVLDSDSNCGGCGKQCTVDALENVTGAGCNSRACEFQCTAGYGDCDDMPNGCETPLTGVNNCTGCGLACSPDRAVGSCADGTCQVAACNGGWADCDGDPANGCETDTGRPENCGGCGIQCQVSPPIGCNGVICTGVLCAEGQADCDGDDTCESDLGDDATCGSCNVSCAFDNNIDGHGSVACIVEDAVPGQMAWACEVTCADGFADCDGDYRNGCEADLTDLDTCGGCGQVCAKARATPTCENRVCEVGTCDLDWGDCDGDDLDCETQLNSANHCGTCGEVCDFPFAAGLCSGSPGSRQCIISQCVPVEYEDCDGDVETGCEADTRSDPLHCNGCGNDCTTGAQVQGGACVGSGCLYTCAPNYRDCTPADGCETNLLSPSSCGSCDTDCRLLDRVDSAGCLPGGGNPVCSVLGCDSGYGDCNGTAGDGCEVHVDSDETHCGACSGDPGHEPCVGLPGVLSSVCSAGSCNLVTCAGDLEDCNRVSADGCEWDPAVDGMCCDPNMDADNDGLDDCADGCPDDPNKSAPGVCGCHVADTDSDGDGSANCIEQCDNDPGKTVPGTCGCGTPDVDADGDGFLACEESCDGDPGKQDPGLCGCGTPEVEYPACQGKRKPLTIQGSQVPGALTDFPVLVRLDADADLAANADGSGLDIYFEDDGGNPLPFERISYAAGTLLAWVKTSLTGSNQVLYVYYGNGGLTEKATPASVWTNGYESAWHLEEAGHPIRDSAGNGYDSTSGSGVASGGGVVGSALEFDGTGTVQTPPVNPASLTFSIWVRLDTLATVQRVLTTTPAAWLFDYRGNQGEGTERFRYWMVGATNYIWNAPGGSATTGGWNHYAVVDPGNGSTHPTLYKNGSPLGWESVPGSFEVRPNAPTATVMGNGAGTSFDGAIDQVSISNVLRSADWILTEYNNQRQGSSFLVAGPQEDL